MNKLSKLIIVAAAVIVAHVASAQNNQPPQNQRVDLNGEWEIESVVDRGLRLLITQNGTNVKATFIHRDEPGNYSRKCETGGQRDHLLEGQLQGASLNGKIMLCMHSEALVKDCGLDAVWETTFKTTVMRNELIDGTWFAEGWGYEEKNGHLVNCHRDDKFSTNDDELKLDRKCYFSGLDWVNRYPDSKSTADLVEPFRTKATKFIAALQAAGATVSVDTTYRPVERSYLMHYAWQIAHGMDPRTVPSYGVIICWVHRDANGNFDLAASKKAAQQMIGPEADGGYGMAHDAAFDDQWFNDSHDTQYSQHNKSTGMDMSITWTGSLTITDGNGKQVKITSSPRNGNDNTDLHAVGATYGVLKLLSDAPHWSATGH